MMTSDALNLSSSEHLKSLKSSGSTSLSHCSSNSLENCIARSDIILSILEIL